MKKPDVTAECVVRFAIPCRLGCWGMSGSVTVGLLYESEMIKSLTLPLRPDGPRLPVRGGLPPGTVHTLRFSSISARRA